MNFTSIVNIPFQLLRLLFLTICFVLFFILYGLYKPGGEAFSIPWYGKVIVTIVLLFGVFITITGLYNGLRTIKIKDDAIYISHIYFFNKRSYMVHEVEMIKEKQYDDSRFYFKGIEISFKNGDHYNFVSYNYLNYRKLKSSAFSFKKQIKR